MLFELGLPSFDTLLHNYKVSFYMSVSSCDNMLVQTTECAKGFYIDLYICSMSLHVCCLSVHFLSVCLVLVVYGPCV